MEATLENSLNLGLCNVHLLCPHLSRHRPAVSIAHWWTIRPSCGPGVFYDFGAANRLLFI